jgi:hypothetical protein
VKKNPTNPTLDALKKAARGLMFPSETDAKLEPFAWGGGGDMTRERLLKQAGAEPGTAAEEQSLDDFFRVVPSGGKPTFDAVARVLKGLET